MSRSLLSILISIICVCTAKAQDVISFELIMPDTIVSGSLYNRIECLDELSGKPNFGYIQMSALSSYKPIVDQVPIQTQLDTLMQRITDETAQKQTLLLQLRILDFNQDNNNVSCRLRFSLYIIKADHYSYLNTLDTTITAKPKEILNEASYAITDYILANLKYMPEKDDFYTIHKIHEIEWNEKENTPVYKAETYKDGIYFSFKSFASQQPDEEKMQVKIKDESIKSVEVMNKEKDKWEKIKSESIFAIIVGGKPYVVDDKKYYPVYKEHNNLMFVAEKPVGSVISPANGGFSISTGSYGTGIGGGVAIRIGSRPKEKVTYMIDHLNGTFLFVEKE